MNEQRVSTSGIGLASILGVVFVILKLCSVITWRWLWVLAPFWISYGLALIVLVVVLIIVAVKSRRRRHAN